MTITASGRLAASGAVTGKVAADGDLAGYPLSLHGRFALDTSAAGIIVPSLKGRWASVVLDVNGFAVSRGRTSGHAQLRIGDLSDASGLAGEKLGGSLEADITAGQAATDRIKARLRGLDVRVGTLAVDSLEAQATVDGPMTTGSVNAALEASGIAGFGDIDALKATASGNWQAIDVSLKASGAQTRADLSANVESTGGGIIVALSGFKGRLAGVPVSLSAPTRFRIIGSGVTLDAASMRVGGGQVTARGGLAPSDSDRRIEGHWASLDPDPEL